MLGGFSLSSVFDKVQKRWLKKCASRFNVEENVWEKKRPITSYDMYVCISEAISAVLLFVDS